jgi:TatD DNase family protein
MEFIDTHAHITMSGYDKKIKLDLDQVVKKAIKANVLKIINVCIDKASLEKGEILQKKYPENIYLAASTTPHDVEKEGHDFFPVVEKLAIEKKLVAIGEVGLDYFYEISKKEIQKKFFIKYLQLAEKTNLPVIIHCRDAFDDLFEMLDKNPQNKKVLLHCFTGSVEEAKEAVKRGYNISFSGIITFKKSTALQNVVKEIPLEKILIETDSPYLSPEGFRKFVNEPSYVLEVAKKIASIKNISLEEVAKITTFNAKNFFNIV